MYYSINVELFHYSSGYVITRSYLIRTLNITHSDPSCAEFLQSLYFPTWAEWPKSNGTDFLPLTVNCQAQSTSVPSRLSFLL